jgi:glutamyl-tRNA(Gln) amidotransferase subunit E
MIGYEPYPGIRIGKELGRMVKFYDLDGVFHSDELPNYGITEKLVSQLRETLELAGQDAFVLVGGPRSKVELAVSAIIERLKSALAGVPAETRAATPEGQTVFLRPRPGAARMYPETDIPTIPVTDPHLKTLAGQVPRPWDEEIESISSKYGLNSKLATQIFDSDYLAVFERITLNSKVPPTFTASKLTEDLVSLQRQGLDVEVLDEEKIVDIFSRLDAGSIAKESVVPIFEKLMKGEAQTVNEAVIAAGASSIADEELGRILDKIIEENMAVVREKGAAAINTVMGRAMAALRGKADGQKINSVLKEKLAKLVS